MKKLLVISLISLATVGSVVVGGYLGSRYAKAQVVKAFEQTEVNQGIDEEAVRRPIEEFVEEPQEVIEEEPTTEEVVVEESVEDPVVTEEVIEEEPVQEEAPKTDGYIHYYNLVPQNVKNNFESNGWQVIQTDLTTLGKSNTLAFMRTRENTIYLDNREASNSAIAHEIYHYVDYMTNSPSQLPEFEEIRQLEVESMASAYPTNSANYNTALEYFAEAGQNCVLHPIEMQELCPRTYDYIMYWSSQLN